MEVPVKRFLFFFIFVFFSCSITRIVYTPVRYGKVSDFTHIYVDEIQVIPSFDSDVISEQLTKAIVFYFQKSNIKTYSYLETYPDEKNIKYTLKIYVYYKNEEQLLEKSNDSYTVFVEIFNNKNEYMVGKIIVTCREDITDAVTQIEFAEKTTKAILKMVKK